jgi:energy-coupling factor transport system permease protein
MCIVKKSNAYKNFTFLLFAMTASAIINPLFNHKGQTILAYFPSGNPLTQESIIYGLCAAISLVSVLCFFISFSTVMTSDKFMYLFGKAIPSLSLVLSMTLRFVPLFAQRLRKTADAQKCIGKGLDAKGTLRKIKNALRILSITVTWALENAIDTADSMKARGFGSAKRSSFSNYSFEAKDFISLLFIAVTGIYTTIGIILGTTNFVFYPAIEYEKLSGYSASVFLCYFLLCFTPVIIEIWEVRKWKRSR